MTDLKAKSEWSAVRQLEVTDRALAGKDGVLNQQAQALLNRTEVLQEKISDLSITTTDIAIGDFELPIMDTNGNVAAGVKTDATFFADSFESSSTKQENIESEFEWGISDTSGNLPLGIKRDGTVKTGILETNSTLQFVIDDEVWDYVITDMNGNVAWGIKKNGNIFPESSAPTPPLNIRLQKTDWIHCGTYGQSLSRGSGAYPVVSTTQPYNNVTFQSGCQTRPSDTNPVPILNAIKPLIEERRTTGAEGESPVSGALNKITELSIIDNDELIFFGNSGGQGGVPIQSLVKGTARYNDQIEVYQAAYDLAQSQNKSYSVAFIHWVHGESNYNRNNTRKEYKDLEVELKSDLNTDIQGITKQDFAPVMITYQTASHHTATPRRDHVNIALAQWDAHRENTDIIMACSMYAMEYLTDNLHLTADSSQQLGKYLGKASYHMWRYVHDELDKPFRPLEPESVIWQGRVIDIEFNVPTGNLTFDTTLVSETHNYGFDIWIDDVIQTNAISNVEVVDKNRVRIVLNRSYTNAVLSYARGRPTDPSASGAINGARGNLRDQEGNTDNYIDSKGVTRYMHNWCVIFQYSQIEGFN